MNPEAKRAALDLAFINERSPLAYEKWTDVELLSRVQEQAPGASPEEYLDALARVRRFCDDVYAVCDAFRDGEFGMGIPARLAALQELAGRSPGFTEADCETAFGAGLLWTAF